MGLTRDLGHRIELVPMDPHFHNITIALHRQQLEGGSAYLINTYSGKKDAADRIAFVRRAMETLGGMELTPEGLLRFPCGDPHELACRRLFLEACKRRERPFASCPGQEVRAEHGRYQPR